MIVAFTGHRSLGRLASRVRKGLRAALTKHWPLYGISGMAFGFDMLAAEICIEMGIPLVAALPCDDMTTKWAAGAKKHHAMLLKKAHEVYVVSPGTYQPWKLQRRNEWLVDHCSKLVSAFDGSSDGGTYNCLAYAAQVGREVIQIEWR